MGLFSASCLLENAQLRNSQVAQKFNATDKEQPSSKASGVRGVQGTWLCDFTCINSFLRESLGSEVPHQIYYRSI